MKYGDEPKLVDRIEIHCKEMLNYQYLPIKFPESVQPIMEERLKCFEPIVGAACCDFIADFGLDRYRESYVYLTAKSMFQTMGTSFNRLGYHSDGFMTDDINYTWCDVLPTIFNLGEFTLSKDDTMSMDEMEDQARPENEHHYGENALLRLDQFSIHRVQEPFDTVLRTFVKVSFSRDRYDLIGNAHNYLLDYDWPMREREATRNIPQMLSV